ncbi:DNA polymerase/3'-5' exonuclease PolX [Patescibacteria group bacterium]|nr:DNA polymerase/3'-5' exonuclease PolX [Patescibacteria group bacterium]
MFYSIAEFLEMDKVPFKPQAYEKAAVAIETLEENIENIYKKGGLKVLEEIPGVGKSIAEKIAEYLKTGKIKYYEEFRKKLPIDIEEITKVEGLGARKAKVLYEKLRIKNLAELERAARLGKIRNITGFGEKTEKNILEGVAFVKRSKGRFLLGYILPQAREVYKKLEGLKEVEKIDMVGSLRRMKETIGDVDFLIISENPEPVMDFFVTLPGVIKIWAKGKTKASVRVGMGFDPVKKISNGVNMDVRVVPRKSYGAALQYFTGSKEHNIHLRKIAIEKGLKLNEYGLFSSKGAAPAGGQGPASGGRGAKMISGENEKDIYKILGLAWIPPELRENQGEIEAALRRVRQTHRRQAQDKPSGLPKIIGYNDIKGDLHCHSNWTRAQNSIGEIAEAAIKMGYGYIGISDHTKFLRIEAGLDEKQLLKQREEIRNLNTKYQILNTKFRILHGCEANILADGSIDIKDEALAKLDYVIAGAHSQFKMPRGQMTARIIRAIENPNVDIISHPTGRLLQKRNEYQIDFDKILRAAKLNGTILEIDAFPDRLDLNDINIRKAKKAGVKMVINTDAHNINHLRYMELGIAQARRGWAEKNDVINTRPVEKLMEFFK